MRDLFASLKKPGLGAAFGVLFGLLFLGQSAQAANPLELNFWLSGPRYDGRVAPCESALATITIQFWEKESNFWNSDLRITGYGRDSRDRVPALAVRQHPAPLLQRRGHAERRQGPTVHYSIIEDGGFAGFGQGVEWCVVGLDRNWAYNPRCRAAKP